MKYANRDSWGPHGQEANKLDGSAQNITLLPVDKGQDFDHVSQLHQRFPQMKTRDEKTLCAAPGLGLPDACLLQIYYFSAVRTSFVKIVVRSVYGAVNNGAEEIEFGMDRDGRNGWLLGGLAQSCTAACSNSGLECTEQMLFDHNSDVDSDAKMKTLVKNVMKIPSWSKISSDAVCGPEYSSNNDVPILASHQCYRSSVNRTLSSFRCDTKAPTNGDKHRVCWCHGYQDYGGARVPLARGLVPCDTGRHRVRAPSLSRGTFVGGTATLQLQRLSSSGRHVVRHTLSSCHVAGTWSAWLDRDDPSGSADAEVVPYLIKEGPPAPPPPARCAPQSCPFI